MRLLLSVCTPHTSQEASEYSDRPSEKSEGRSFYLEVSCLIILLSASTCIIAPSYANL